MSLTDNPVRGKDHQVQILLDGVPVEIRDTVRFTVTPQYDTTETKPLGTHRTRHDAVPNGWELQVEVELSRVAADDFEDTVRSARIAGTPVTITVTDSYSDNTGARRTHLYPDCTLTGGSTTIERANTVTKSYTFKTGEERLTS